MAADNGNDDPGEAPATSRSPGTHVEDWRTAKSPSPGVILTGLFEIDGLVSNIAAEQRRSFDGLRHEHRVQKASIDDLHEQLVVLTAESEKAKLLLHDINSGQAAQARNIEFLAGEIKGLGEGMKAVVATKGELAEVRDVALANKERIDRVENRADETGRTVIRFAGERNVQLEKGEIQRRSQLRHLAASILLLVAGGIIQWLLSGR